MRLYRTVGKRALDLALVVPGLVLASPLLAVVALAVRVTLGSPVLFRQTRPGLHGRPFRFLKFRTMHPIHPIHPMQRTRAPHGGALPDSARLTSLGRFLRRWSLDELPSLFNVLRGDMSLVGPRPLLLEYLERYSPQQMRRHEVRPGITGWAQVNGRNAQSWDRRFELDLYYVREWGLRLDLRILARTAWQVLRGQGVSAPGHSTMPRFQGNGR